MIGIFEITTQTYFTVLLRTRISGHYGRKKKKKKNKQTSSIYLTDRFPSKTLFKIIISNQLQGTPTRIIRWQSTYKIQNTTSHHYDDPLKRTRQVSPEVSTISHRSDTHRGGKVHLHVNQKNPRVGPGNNTRCLDCSDSSTIYPENRNCGF